MLPSERRKMILMEIESKGNASITDLKALLNVSIDTVRRDLEHLERLDKLQRVHGGAIAKGDVVTNQMFMKRKIAFLERKQELAGYAARFVRENQAVSINAGTTNIEVAKHLAVQFERLTVITNALKIAEIFAGKRGSTVIIPGGVLDHDEFSLHGHSIAEQISRFNIDTAFISINAISLEKGLTDFRQGEAEIINAMLQSARQRIVVADSSKFETVSYLNICGLDQIDVIVTDSQLDEQTRQAYESRRISIVNAQREEEVSGR